MNDILLLGCTGQLGWELQRSLAVFGAVHAYDQPEVDFTQIGDLRTVIRMHKPRLIMNAAAYTAVDRAEEEPEVAKAVNTLAPEVIAREAKRLAAVLIHFSTDYVFDGSKTEPYREDDAPNPLNVYGETKLEGERAIIASGCPYFIFRTSWVYSFRRPSFPLKVLRWARAREQVRIVDDQVSNPTWARMLAQAVTLTAAMGWPDLPEWAREKGALYHLAGKGSCSRFELAQETLRLYEKITGERLGSILPAKTHEFVSPATRPPYSALGCSKFERAFQLQLPPWQESLEMAIASHLDHQPSMND